MKLNLKNMFKVILLSCGLFLSVAGSAEPYMREKSMNVTNPYTLQIVFQCHARTCSHVLHIGDASHQSDFDIASQFLGGLPIKLKHHVLSRSLDEEEVPAAKQFVSQISEDYINGFGHLRVLMGVELTSDEPRINGNGICVKVNTETLTVRIKASTGEERELTSQDGQLVEAKGECDIPCRGPHCE